jgi:hypothetical protein
MGVTSAQCHRKTSEYYSYDANTIKRLGLKWRKRGWPLVITRHDTSSGCRWWRFLDTKDSCTLTKLSRTCNTEWSSILGFGAVLVAPQYRTNMANDTQDSYVFFGRNLGMEKRQAIWTWSCKVWGRWLYSTGSGFITWQEIYWPALYSMQLDKRLTQILYERTTCCTT